MHEKVSRPLQWLNAVAFAAVLALNALAELLPLGGATTGQISQKYQTLFTPAALTFAVWGLVYLLAALFVLHQAGLVGKPPSPAAQRVGPWFILSCLCNMGWILCWHYQRLGLSLLCMAGLLLTLILCYIRADAGPLTRREAPLVRLPFSVYLGWISVATIANVASVLRQAGWHGFGLGESFWTAALLALALGLGLATVLSRRDAAYGLTLVWGFLGIFLRHWLPTGYDRAYPAALWTAAVCAILLLGVSLAVLAEKAAESHK